MLIRSEPNTEKVCRLHQNTSRPIFLASLFLRDFWMLFFAGHLESLSPKKTLKFLEIFFSISTVAEYLKFGKGFWSLCCHRTQREYKSIPESQFVGMCRPKCSCKVFAEKPTSYSIGLDEKWKR